GDDTPFLESRKMIGSFRIRRSFGVLFAFMCLGVFSMPAPSKAQTAEERAREEQLLLRAEEQFRHQKEAHLAQLQEALAHVREQMARVEAEHRLGLEAEAAKLEQLQEAMIQARIQAEQAGGDQERILALAREHQAQELARVRELALVQRERAGAFGVQQEERARELERRMQEVVVRSREQARDARSRLEDRLREVQEVVIQMRARVRLGVSLAPDQGEEDDRQGVRLVGIIEDSPAEEAGLLEGDIITHLNGQALTMAIPGEEDEDFDPEESLPVQRLMALVQEMDAGEEVEVRYIRDGEVASVTLVTEELDRRVITLRSGDEEGAFRVLRFDPENEIHWEFRTPEEGEFRMLIPKMDELGELENLRLTIPDMEELRELEDLRVRIPELRFRELGERGIGAWTVSPDRSTAFAYRVAGGGTSFGLRTTPLNPGLAEYFSTGDGILILEVEEDSGLGLSAGDVILSIDGRDVEDQGDLVRILSSYEADETVTFTVVRKGEEIQVEGVIR
ncbi:PDZ domain-containing protein, partial [Gemmatimonadota bacterium]